MLHFNPIIQRSFETEVSPSSSSSGACWEMPQQGLEVWVFQAFRFYHTSPIAITRLQRLGLKPSQMRWEQSVEFSYCSLTWWLDWISAFSNIWLLFFVCFQPSHLGLESVTLLVHFSQGFEFDLSLNFRGVYGLRSRGLCCWLIVDHQISFPGIGKSSVDLNATFSRGSFPYKPTHCTSFYL